MNALMYSRLSETSRIGISVDSDSLEAPETLNGYKYLSEPIKKLTKANSFSILDEIFYIVKKDFKGKANRHYHVYRMSDMMLIVAPPLSKEDTIKLVMERYIEMGI